jgi:spore maturation protein SpmB
LREAFSVSLLLFRILIPVLIVVKLLELAGGIALLGKGLAPVMSLVGLPGTMGLVWAAAMITSLYGGIVVFLTIAPTAGLTCAQVTVLSTMMLVAHSMPVELGVARQAGTRVRFMAPWRILGALAIGMVLNSLYSLGGFLQQPAEILWRTPAEQAGLGDWALGQLRNLGMIFVAVTILMAFLRVLDRIGVTALLNRLLRPILVSMGIGPSASTITIFGMILGLSYGGGLIISGARSGAIPMRDVFFSLCLMGLAHSVVEDSLLMLSLGASMTGVLIARVAFAWLAMWALVKLVRRVPDATFFRHFCREAN